MSNEYFHINIIKVKMLQCTRPLLDRGLISKKEYMAYAEKVLRGHFYNIEI